VDFTASGSCVFYSVAVRRIAAFNLQLLFKARQGILSMDEIAPESTQMDGMTVDSPDEPPELQYSNRRYEVTDYLANEEQRLLNRLNAVWKRICVSLKLFHVTATAGSVVYTCKDSDDIVESEYKVKINLTCELFTADLQLVYTENTRGFRADDCDEDISYKLWNMVIRHKSATLQPLVLNKSKRVFQTRDRYMVGFNQEAMLMDAMFVLYDILSSMRRLLICNKVLVAARALRKLKNKKTPEPIPDDIKGFIFRSYRKVSEESANELLHSLLLECRPQWVAPESMEFILNNTLSNPRIVNPVRP